MSPVPPDKLGTNAAVIRADKVAKTFPDDDSHPMARAVRWAYKRRCGNGRYKWGLITLTMLAFDGAWVSVGDFAEAAALSKSPRHHLRNAQEALEALTDQQFVERNPDGSGSARPNLPAELRIGGLWS